MQNLVIQTAQHLLNCNYTGLERNTFFHHFFTGPGFVAGDHLHKYRDCMSLNRTKQENETKEDFIHTKFKHFRHAINGCLGYIQNACERCNIRAFKTIRMTLEQAYHVLQADPDVKVIYSTRDPRGMISSRIQVDVSGHRNNKTYQVPFERHAHSACQRLRHDRQFIAKLKEEFPDNFYLTNYETIYGDVRGAVADVYKFLNLDIQPSVTAWVRRQMSAHERHRHGNQIDKWRTLLTREQIQTVYDSCGDLIQVDGKGW